MNAFTTKKGAIALSLCLAYASYSYSDDLDSRVSSLESRMGAVKTQTAKGTIGAKMATAHPLIDSYGLFINADFLAWHLKEGQSQYVIKNKEATIDTVHGNTKNVNFNWDFGFRLGAGYNFEHDEWDANLNFTWFQCAAHNQTKARSSGSLIPEFGMLDSLGRKAKVEWNVGYYVLDAELGRHFFVSKFLAFRPFFGIETAWINQHMHFDEHLLPGQDQSRLIVKNKNDFWGIGPRAGFGSNWYFCESVSLFGNVSGALLWGDFDIREKEKAKGLVPLKLSDISGDMHCIVPNAQMILGIQYDVNFNENCNHIGVKLGYEFQYWWKQNQILTTFVPVSPIFERESGDLSFNGVTLDVRFDF